MPDPLDVAKQRKLIEDLKREGQQTQEAETRLQTMLECMTAARAYRCHATEKSREKSRRDSSEAA